MINKNDNQNIIYKKVRFTNIFAQVESKFRKMLNAT